MDVKIYRDPNPAIGAALVSPRMRSICYEIAELGVALYRERVAKVTGNLAAAAHPSTEFTDVLKGQPRWCGVITVGGAVPAGEYVLPHEFGRHAEVEGPQQDSDDVDTPVVSGGHHAARDLNWVLEQLGAW